MKYDGKIKSLIQNIKFNCDCYLEDITYFNECESANRIAKKIIDNVNELKKYYEDKFRMSEKILKGSDM